MTLKNANSKTAAHKMVKRPVRYQRNNRWFGAGLFSQGWDE
jgi:hypothetical protein